MKKIDGKETHWLSMRLLKKGRAVDRAFRDDHELREVATKQGGRLFTGQGEAKHPSWVGFINGFASKTTKLSNMSCGSVLFLEVNDPSSARKKRTIALTFGTGHHALNPDAFERNFGLRTVLNSVPRNKLRSLDVAVLDATTFQKRIQASRNADLQGFGVDVERDLLRLAQGVPTDTAFAKSVAGRDALSILTKTSAADVTAKCEAALKFYQSTDYRKDFEWIDYVSEVKDKSTVAVLNGVVFKDLEALVAGNASDLHLALPDILSPEEGYEIGYFGVGFKSGAKQSYGEIAIEDYVAELRAGKFADIADMDALKSSHEVRVITNGEGDKRKKRKLYDCFVYEHDYKGATYVLFGGDWFQIDKAFQSTVEKDFVKLVSKKPFRAKTKCRTEKEFITDLDNDKDLLNLDVVKLSPFAAKGANLEPCDFFSRAKQFIHLKDGHSSQPISHLWFQAMVSAESFVRDEKFRIDLREAAIKRQAKKPKKSGFETLLPDGRSKPVPGDYTVVFGIMRNRHKKSGTLSLPFFSKVSLRAVADRIDSMGYPMEVHLIERV
jgi:uncharacterized protein (TIGR04141 family)